MWERAKCRALLQLVVMVRMIKITKVMASRLGRRRKSRAVPLSTMRQHFIVEVSICRSRLPQVRNMKTLDEALTVFTKEEVVSFKWDKEVNPETGGPCVCRAAHT